MGLFFNCNIFFRYIWFYFFQKYSIKDKKWGEFAKFILDQNKVFKRGFSSIKDIKLLNRIGEILHKYTSNNTIINQCEIKKTFTEFLVCG